MYVITFARVVQSSPRRGSRHPVRVPVPGRGRLHIAAHRIRSLPGLDLHWLSQPLPGYGGIGSGWVRQQVSDSDSSSEWQYVGEWYTSGSNTCVYSRPEGRNFSEAELAATEHHVITSNRRWREEEFLIPRHLTSGTQRLQVKIEYVPNHKELFPGHPYPHENLWSESRYWVYCYQLPTIQLE